MGAKRKSWAARVSEELRREDRERERCSRCRKRGPQPFYSDGVGANAIFNGQRICGSCATELDRFA